MKAIIYGSESAAKSALTKCNTITQGEPENLGRGPFAEVFPKPYTSIVPHPDGVQFALIADSKVEAKLKKNAVELTEDWFPNPLNTTTDNG